MKILTVSIIPLICGFDNIFRRAYLKTPENNRTVVLTTQINRTVEKTTETTEEEEKDKEKDKDKEEEKEEE